jgi:2-oxoglutarate ferredoxin oxidoreductase subunit alpha
VKENHPINDSVIRIAGNSQDGIQSVGTMLARMAGRVDMDVMTYMTIPATISGGPSIFQVHMGTATVLTPGDMADVLVAFYQHSYETHLNSLRDGGVLIYDDTHVDPDLDALRKRRITPVAVPMTALTVETVGGTGTQKGKNIFLLGLLTHVYRLDYDKIASLVKEQFRGKDSSVVRNNLLALEAGYAYQIGDIGSFFAFETKPESGEINVTMSGNQALAYGAIAGGIRFGAGYPITPWTEVMEILRRELPLYGGLFIQTEDELAAIAAAIGAAYGGTPALTGSSGPGLSLKAEALGFAVMAELPLVIVDVQRGGPSTGLPTNVEQGDLSMALYGSHGDAPRVVLAAANVEDCFYLMVEAARIAKRFSVPVILLSDQALATRLEAFPYPNLESVVEDPRRDLSVRASHKPYPLDAPTRHAPPGTPIADGRYPTITGLEHDEYGNPSGNPQMHVRMTQRRSEKIRRLAAELPVPEVYGAEGADTLLVGWGSTRGVIRAAVDQSIASGEPLAALHLRHINPLPLTLAKILGAYKHVLVVELNEGGVNGCGQLGRLLRSETCLPQIQGITKSDGASFRVVEVLDRVRGVLEASQGGGSSPQ